MNKKLLIFKRIVKFIFFNNYLKEDYTISITPSLENFKRNFLFEKLEI